MPTRLAMPQPFASGTNATRATIASVSGDSVNYVDGFPGKYSLPASEGGKYVSRGEMNAIGNMASNDIHYFKCGGLNTFDEAFCAAIGGYPKGAVLEYINDYKLYEVISLIDNNSVNFLTDGIDGVNWQFLNQDIAEINPDYKEFTFAGDGYGVIAIFKSSKNSNGYYIEASCSTTEEKEQDVSLTLSGGESKYYSGGDCLAIHDMGTEETGIPDLPSAEYSFSGATGTFSYSFDPKGWCKLYGNTFIDAYGIKNGSSTVSEMNSDNTFDTFLGFKKDHYYAVCELGSFERTTLLGQETASASQVALQLKRAKYKIKMNVKIYYC